MATVGETRLDATQTRPAPVDGRRYSVVGPLSRGGMAELLLAQQFGVKGFSRVVAIKRVLASHAEDKAFLEMFLDEARLAARLDHPHIVRIYDLGQDGETYFLAMEYLPGEDLRQLHEVVSKTELKVAPELAAHLVERAADALHFAHELTDETGAPLHLVHRDVSPSNVIVTYDGQVKVVDFGIAKATSNDFETGAGVLKGKLGYLAPEQLSGEAIDRRTDVFGLGILLWELLTNTRLFVRDTPAATMAAASQGEVPPISTFRDDVSPKLEAIALRALERAPAARYQTAGEMRDELELYLHTEAMPPTSRDVTQWMASLGGVRRASLKMSIARGRNVQASYTELTALRWDDTSAPATPYGSDRRKHREPWKLAAFAGLGLAVMLGAGVATAPREPRPSPRPSLASAHLESDPAGAFIFVRGEPTGQLTPTTLTGLDPASPLEFRLEKPGHASVGGSLPLKAGAVASRRLTLVANKGVVRFTNLPRGALVRIAGLVVLPGQEVLVTPGQQVAELVVGGEVVSTQTFTIMPGAQELQLPGGTR